MANFEGRKSKRQARKYADIGRILIKEEVKARVKQITGILKKEEELRTDEEKQILQESPEIVKSIDKRAKHRDTAKQRLLEIEDEPECLSEKCRQLAAALRECKQVVVYTGAGISTAASIPDYRGPNGVWTLLQQGKELKAQDLSDAEPTVTHMAITNLYYENMVSHVVSQNCDGLHLRSGLPRQVLSEVHGNMYIEMCKYCKTSNEYIRLFDVTEKTGVRRHRTERECQKCGSELRDTIVHFGEKGSLSSPYNWQTAADAADDADLILCLGSSLKILRKYPCLWHMDMRPKDRPQLFIVNLQWTPKDDLATLKINGKCDEVMRLVMAELDLEIPAYHREKDPIFKLATKLSETESKMVSKKMLQIPVTLEPSQFSYNKKKNAKKKQPTKRKIVAPSQKYRTIKALLDGQVKTSELEIVESDQNSQDSKESISTNSSVSVSEPPYKMIRQILHAQPLQGDIEVKSLAIHEQDLSKEPDCSSSTLSTCTGTSTFPHIKSETGPGTSSDPYGGKTNTSTPAKRSRNSGAKHLNSCAESGDRKKQSQCRSNTNNIAVKSSTTTCKHSGIQIHILQQNPTDLAQFALRKFPCLVSSSNDQPILESGEIKTDIASYDLCKSNMRQDKGPETEDESSPTVIDDPAIFNSGYATTSCTKPTLTSIPGWFGKGLNPRKRKRKL